jgi:hypothetical protein
LAISHDVHDQMGRYSDHHQLHRLRYGCHGGITFKPFDLGSLGVHWKNSTAIAQIEEVPQDRMTHFARCSGSSNHSHALGFKENSKAAALAL